MAKRKPRTTPEGMGRSDRPRGGGDDRPDPVRVSLVSLGCAKNLIDSERILGAAGIAGIEIASHPDDADVIVINTCGFIGPAREESLGAIREACGIKERSRRPKKVVVVGCLAQRSGGEILREAPGVDAILGLGQYGGIGEFLADLVRKNGAVLPPLGPVLSPLGSPKGTVEGTGGLPIVRVADPTTACNAEVGRFRLTPPHYAYLRISEGCDNPCTFCTIPSIRGRFRSKPIPEVETEARELVASGARELVLISQDTTSYGSDLEGGRGLADLLDRLASVDGVRWIRVLYAYPTSLDDRIIDAIVRIPQVVKYIDLPIQHIDERMLRRMGRRMDEAGTRRLLDRLRERIPGLYLRTTLLVGFPGEGKDEFRRLLDFVRDFRFERLGAFAYSREEGTPAARLGEEVPEELRKERFERIMLAQQEVAFAQSRSRIGQVCEAVVDGRESGRMTARSAGEAPEIDPRIFLVGNFGNAARGGGNSGNAARGGGNSGNAARGGGNLALGEFVEVRITGARDYDLFGKTCTRNGR
jgi:ribosomal protein S12 methylthiotransferase